MAAEDLLLELVQTLPQLTYVFVALGSDTRNIEAAVRLREYGYFKKEMHVDIAARNIAPYNNSFEALVKDLKKYKKNGYRVLLLSGSRTRARRLAEDLRNTEDAGLTAVYTEDPMREVAAHKGR